MSHKTAIAGLKGLLNQDFFDADPKEQAKHMMAESDRSSIILLAATIEYTILRSLKARMPSLNSDEQAAIFNFEGPCGSYSNRIRLAHGLGIFDRATKRRIEVIKEMRNTAAHSFAPIRFDVPQIVQAVAQLFPPNTRTEIMGWDLPRVRAAFMQYCMRQGQAFVQDKALDMDDLFNWLRVQKVRPLPWRATQPGA